MYKEQGAVCPPNLVKNVFVTGAADNADHNPSSTTSKQSFHGTVLQLNSHPSLETQGEEIPTINLVQGAISSKCVPLLPDYYTEIIPVTKLKVVTAPEVNFVFPETRTTEYSLQRDKCWLEHIKNVIESDEINDPNIEVSWSAFHASRAEKSYEPTTKSAMLPLFEEQAHSPAMIRHAMVDIVKTSTEILNNGQTPVLTFDQPLFAIAKQIQWNFPQKYGEQKFVVLFGPLHIEMAILKILGCILEGSGWAETLVNAEVAHQGTADSFIRASHVTKTRRAHQVTVAALFILKNNAYEDDDKAQSEGMSFETWSHTQEENVPQFKYWSIVMRLELLLLGFIRSIREGNFKLYKEMLVQIVPWCFALNRINYSRWLTVHLRDMLLLEETSIDVFREFEKGNFVIRKTKNPFSAIGIDHALEQTNALIKGDGGAIGILQSPDALRRWMIVGPEVAKIVTDFESKVEVDHHHHEQNKSFQRNFASDVVNLLNSFDSFGNPFKETSTDLFRLHTKEIMSEDTKKTIMNIEKLGEEKSRDFVNERLISQVKNVSDVIKKNKLFLFGTAPSKKKTKLQLQIKTLKNDCALFSRFYIGCQMRNGDLDKFFQHENNPCPPSISQDGYLRTGKKSDILSCLEDPHYASESVLQFDAMLLDGAAIVNMLKPPKHLKTFEEYATRVFVPYITAQFKKAPRVDLIWDVYRADSLKGQTRDKRGQGIRRRVEPSNSLPINWQEFLRTNENKSELFKMLGNFVLSIDESTGIVIVTEDNLAFSNSEKGLLERISPCNHEEADTRIILHLSEILREGREVLVRTVDSDVVVLCIVIASRLSKKVWIEFGVGKHVRLIPAHTICETLGPEKAAALPFFHAFTGCDTCSSFSGKGKKSSWKVWTLLPEVTTTFMTLSSTLKQIDEQSFEVLEKFTVMMYDRTSTVLSVNACRKDLFTQKNKTMESLPPTQDALRHHILRSTLQAGHIWGSAHIAMQQLPDPSIWGWVKGSSGMWEPKWTSLPDAMSSCDEVQVCKCKNDCNGDKCSCYITGQPCCASCKCRGECSL